MIDAVEFIYPDWPAPSNVRCLSTTRLGGVSTAPYQGNNLALHVGDKPENVQQNRARLAALGALPGEPAWLGQTHTNHVVHCESEDYHADGRYADRSHQVCVVMTADCLPVLICDKAGSQVAAIHAGWRGLANNILENGVALFRGSRADLMVWLGPAIGKQAFEVGQEVYGVFVKQYPGVAVFFEPTQWGKYFMDIYGLATLLLNKAGIRAVYGGEYCTYSNEALFFSYRRDGICGRMASLIWLDMEKD